jgi:hypothetical protein
MTPRTTPRTLLRLEGAAPLLVVAYALTGEA